MLVREKELYKIPKSKKVQFYNLKKLNKKASEKNTCLCTLFVRYMLL